MTGPNTININGNDSGPMLAKRMLQSSPLKRMIDWRLPCHGFGRAVGHLGQIAGRTAIIAGVFLSIFPFSPMARASDPLPDVRKPGGRSTGWQGLVGIP